MKHSTSPPRWVPLLTVLSVMAGCEADVSRPVADKKKPSAGPIQPVAVGKNVSLEVDGERRRVWLTAYVCQREGAVEHLLTRRRTKEHEAILAADVDARHIHAALVLARAQPGSPVRFYPEYHSARGTRVRVLINHEGLSQSVPAQQWLRHCNSKKDLDLDWVFAGSALLPNSQGNREPFYAANEGDLICVSNFDGALLDLPILSSQDNNHLQYEANTYRIPAVDTPVFVILEPIAGEK